MQHIVILSVAVILIGSTLCIAAQSHKPQVTVSEEIMTKSVKNEPLFDRYDKIRFIARQPWHSNIDVAFEIAKDQNKNVIVMVGEDSCKWCNKIVEDTFTDSRVISKFNDYILVYIKRSDKDSLQYTPEFDGNIPSIFFMDANKRVIEGIIGYFLADDFVEYMKEIEQ